MQLLPHGYAEENGELGCQSIAPPGSTIMKFELPLTRAADGSTQICCSGCDRPLGARGISGQTEANNLQVEEVCRLW